MTKEKTTYDSMPGDYDTDKLTDIHSSESDPSSYARNILHSTNVPHSKDSHNSSDRNNKIPNVSDSTGRIPTLIKYSNVNTDDDKFEYKGEI